MKKIVISIVVLVIAAGAILAFLKFKQDKPTFQFQFGEITRGDIENSISSTGTLNAVGTVEIGTQVSGTIARLYKDFNDVVRAGQLLALLDTTNLIAAIEEVSADFSQAQAQLDQAQAEYDRNEPLHQQGYISDAELITFRTALATRKAAIRSLQARMDRAKQNLSYAYIRSPIAGTIIQRNVEQGQTVAASFSAPVLFVIAEDLAQMEIHALVDESDIGNVKVGQAVKFTVPAYFDKTFTGTVRQIRLQPSVVQNVVNYTAVVDAKNDNNQLLPGMTATVEFITEQKEDILLIPNAALRFKPSEELVAYLRAEGKLDSAITAGGQITRQRGSGTGGGGGRGEGRNQRGDSTTRTGNSPEFKVRLIHYLDANGVLHRKPVKIGITNETVTEILPDAGIDIGIKVVNSVIEPVKAKTNGTSGGALGAPPAPGAMRGFGRM